MGRQKIGLSQAALDASRIMGHEVRIARTNKGWTQRMLSARASVSERTVSMIERGNPAVSFGNVLNVATAVGLPLFQTEQEDLGRLRTRREEVAALIPQRVVEEDFSHVDLDF